MQRKGQTVFAVLDVFLSRRTAFGCEVFALIPAAISRLNELPGLISSCSMAVAASGRDDVED